MSQSPEARYVEQQTKKRIGALEKDLGDLQKHQRTVESEKQAEALQKLMDKERSANEAYTKLIIAAGYAGFLTFWSKSGRRYLSHTTPSLGSCSCFLWSVTSATRYMRLSDAGLQSNSQMSV